MNLIETALADFRLENGIGEQLHGKWIEEDEPAFQIIRHQAELNTKEVLEWIGKVTTETTRGRIRICNPTIG